MSHTICTYSACFGVIGTKHCLLDLCFFFIIIMIVYFCNLFYILIFVQKQILYIVMNKVYTFNVFTMIKYTILIILLIVHKIYLNTSSIFNNFQCLNSNFVNNFNPIFVPIISCFFSLLHFYEDILSIN